MSVDTPSPGRTVRVSCLRVMKIYKNPARLCNFIHLNAPKQMLTAAIEKSSLERMRELEERQGLPRAGRFETGTRFMRADGNVAGSVHFSSDDEAYLRELFAQNGLRINIDA